MSTQTTEVPTAIELIVEQDEAGQVAANVPVRWKISQEMVQSLAEQGVDPYMLLIVMNGTFEMDRVLVPLKSGMTYLQMQRPGINVIHATIVWETEDGASIKKVLFNKDDYGNYQCQLFRHYVPGRAELEDRIYDLDDRLEGWDDTVAPERQKELKRERKELRAALAKLNEQDLVYDLYDDFQAFERTAERDQLAVEVPEAMFAPPPGPVIRWLATLYGGFWQRGGWRDQCDMRRRALFTALTLPIAAVGVILFMVLVAVFWLIGKVTSFVVTAVLLFFGIRNLDYTYLQEWGEFDPKTVLLSDTNPSFWRYRKVDVEIEGWNGTYTDTQYERRDVAFDFINPPFIVGSFMLGYVLNDFFDVGSSPAGILMGVVAAAVVIGLTASAIVRRQNSEKPEPSKVTVSAEQRSRLERELAALTSGGAAKLSDLPKEQRTVKLRYLDLKASVCKPYAK